MARQKSEDKRTAILQATAAVLAEHGSGNAPTAEISRRAGIAEGTLFIYFKTKDELIDAVYQQIRLAADEAMMVDFPRHKKVRRRLCHLWNGYARWGVANPLLWKVLSRQESLGARSPEIQSIAVEAKEQGLIRRALTEELVVRAFDALALAAIETAILRPAAAEEILVAGFKMFWTGVARKGKSRVKE